MIKKYLCVLLTLCLCINLCAALAEEDAGDGIPFRYAEAITRIGNQALFYADEGFFTTTDNRTWTRFGSADVQTALNARGSVFGIAANDDSVFILCAQWDESGETYSLHKMNADSGIDKICDLNLGADGYIMISSMAAIGSDVYIVVENASGMYGENNIYRVSESDGSVTDMGVFRIAEACPYKDGTLLVSGYGMDSSISVFDPATKKMTTLIQMENYNCGGIAWDRDTDTIYFADSSCLYRLLSGEKKAEVCAYLTPGYGRFNSSAVAAGGLYFIRDYNTEHYYEASSTDPALMPSRTLRLACNYADDVTRSYISSHKEIAVQIQESGWDVETITNSLITGSAAADVYSVNLSGGLFSILRNKGYCCELTDSPKLMEFVSSMYPHLTSEFLRDGKLYAIPVEISISCNFAYYPAVLEELGLTEDDLPRTWMEMLDFVQRWDAEIAPDCNDEFKLTDNDYNPFQMFFGYLFQDRMLQCQFKGETLTMNTPETLAVLKRLVEMKPLLDGMSQNPDNMMGGAVFYSGSGSSSSLPSSLFCSYADLTPGGYRGSNAYYRKPLLLTVSPDDAQTISANITLYIINPNSQNKDLAVDFLEYMADNLSASFKIAMNPSMNDPVENAYFQENLEIYQTELAAVQKAYDEAPAEDKAAYQENLDMILEFYEYFEQNERWDVSAESIAEYRTYAPNLVCTQSAWASGNTADLSTLLSRFMDGQINVDQFVKEFDRIIMMMEMENQ